MSNNNQYNNILTADDEDISVTIELEDGEELECEILTIFEIEDQDYIVLSPLEENDDEEDHIVYIYRYFEDAEGNPSLENIEDDEELEMVEEVFEQLLDEASEEE